MPTRFITPALLFSLWACASDPHKEVRSAETELNQSQLQGENKKAPPNAPPEEKREAQATTARNVADAKADLETARVNMRKQRDRFNVDARARFEKADARATEARALSSKLAGRKASEFQGAWLKYLNTRQYAAKKLDNLVAVSDDIWAHESANTDKAISLFDKTVDELFSDL